MLKQFACSTLLACSFGASANDWQQEFFRQCPMNSRHHAAWLWTKMA